MSGENDVADIMVLKNKSVKDIAYKIKVTSPEKFRIRPSTGIIPSGGTEFIRIYLQNGNKFPLDQGLEFLVI